MELLNYNINKKVYLAEKSNLLDILKTGIIPKVNTSADNSSKVFLISLAKKIDIGDKKEYLQVLVLRNKITGKISDSYEKISELLRFNMKDEDYNLETMSIKEYLLKKVKMIKKTQKTQTTNINQFRIPMNKTIIDSVVGDIIEELFEKSKSSMKKTAVEEIEEKIDNITKVMINNETLVISEKNNKIYLPYTIDQLEEYLKCYPTVYTTLKDVINKEFVISLNNFKKHPIQSRFLETYNLMRNKEGKIMVVSFFRAVRLGIKQDLNPAVIAACKNKNELDNYLRCLKSKRAEEFKEFKIVHEKIGA